MECLRQASCLIVAFYMLSIAVAESNIGESCIKRFTKGRWKSHGNCDDAKEQQIRQKITEELKVVASKTTALETTAVKHTTAQTTTVQTTATQTTTAQTTAAPTTTPRPPLNTLFPKEPITDPVSPYDCGQEGNISVTRRCMFIPRLTAKRDLGYDEAIALCNDGGGSLAEIHDRSDENAVNTYMNGKLPGGRRFVYIWIGTLYDYQKSTVLFKSGKELPITKFAWYTNFPKGTDRPYMMVELLSSGSRPRVWNERRAARMYGVLCQKKLWQPQPAL